eukprot:Seg1496.4 transcript_id=Seg1496.4/GoldUCD/mRNA.D3Y31 product="hypothetical protein" protein_id=Seg1496.4/GoldUCD/D3Y31
MSSNRQRLKFGLGQSCKSTNSNIPFKVTFRNLTDREVLLYWIDYQGKPKFYGLLRKTKAIGEGLAIDTFVTHPWIAIDKTKLEVLSINFSHVLRPITKRDFVKEEQKIDRLRVLPKHAGSLQEQEADQSQPEENLHLDAFITDPVLQLEVLCCLKICQKAKTRDQLASLQLPRHVVDQLLYVYDTLMITD